MVLPWTKADNRKRVGRGLTYLYARVLRRCSENRTASNPAVFRRGVRWPPRSSCQVLGSIAIHVTILDLTIMHSSVPLYIRTGCSVVYGHPHLDLSSILICNMDSLELSLLSYRLGLIRGHSSPPPANPPLCPIRLNCYPPRPQPTCSRAPRRPTPRSSSAGPAPPWPSL
jgi:hypothetical protein